MKKEVRVPLCLEWSNNQIVGATVIHDEETRLNQNVKKNHKERIGREMIWKKYISNC